MDTVSMKDFALIKVLGKGAYGKVFLVRKIGGSDHGIYYAMKVLKKERVASKQKSLEHALMERKVLIQLRGCPFLVNMIYAFQSESKLHIIMEYVSGGELFTHLCRRRYFPPQMARFYLAELAVALEYVHQNGVIYRDLKLENILLDSDGHVKLTDFGLSKAFDIDKELSLAHSYCGTVEYLAPEVVKRDPAGYNKLADWWSYGVIAFELLTGCSPFTVDGDHNSAREVGRRILEKTVPYPKNMDSVCRNFIASFLERDQSKRVGSNDIKDFEKHPFFKGIDWDSVRNRNLESPFKPHVGGQNDVRNFAPEFTAMEPVFTPGDVPDSYNTSMFMGYSYISPSVMYSNNNVIGEENLDSNLNIKQSPFFEKYELVLTNDGFLGHGTFSVCRKCRRISDGKQFAVKIVSQKFSHQARREVRILETVNPHPNIVNFVEVLEDYLHFYIVLELLSGGELLHRLKNLNAFTECEASKFMSELVAAVSHLHSKSVVHRDLKPENILFENDTPEATIKLIDFGFARLLPNTYEQLTTPCFTLAYAAPEVIEVEDELPQYNQQCDLWSLGVIMFTMLSGKVPFHAKTTAESANDIIARIRSAEFSFDDPVFENVSDMAKDLITGLLTIDPKKRLTLAELCRHPWISMHKKNNILAEVKQLPTPTLLPRSAGESFNETITALWTANKAGFHLMDVTTAPLLVKRRGTKRTNQDANDEKNDNTLASVSELNEDHQRPSTLDIYGSAPNSAVFTEYRDTKPPELKYSRDCPPHE
ncbi:unnamed protein product [Bursaphelenchus okinawaensis]|uniref:Ribosomal protein S6 kinase n=1 Tax=Bursaphelenchus okinawaensis TaxID=465554 RepID=A0A811JV12_9BILA|nr:unnamed protein product [Bursaphelenchus okinawaensis]CAG9084373.1 unnamed protein product [Bursaphelenchus okinawaensis]